ncbi:hypothetical protein D3C78_1137160 [compost metagenome]
MFGPVITSMRVLSSRLTSLATKGVLSTCSTTGWRPWTMRRQGSSTNAGQLRSRFSARSARLLNTSSSARAAAVSCSGARDSIRMSIRASYSSFSRASARLFADSALSSNALSSGVMKRSAPLRVWRRI